MDYYRDCDQCGKQWISIDREKPFEICPRCSRNVTFLLKETDLRINKENEREN